MKTTWRTFKEEKEKKKKNNVLKANQKSKRTKKRDLFFNNLKFNQTKLMIQNNKSPIKMCNFQWAVLTFINQHLWLFGQIFTPKKLIGIFQDDKELKVQYPTKVNAYFYFP